MTEHATETETTEETVSMSETDNENVNRNSAIDLNTANAALTEEEPETFPREYVVKLRQEAADHRVRASDRDALAERLHASLVAATGRLADPSDLTYAEDHLTDPDALTAAVDELLTRKPHLASRRIVGDVGQGATGGDSSVDLAGMLRRNAS